jgi:hypothetical protein
MERSVPNPSYFNRIKARKPEAQYQWTCGLIEEWYRIPLKEWTVACALHPVYRHNQRL